MMKFHVITTLMLVAVAGMCNSHAQPILKNKPLLEINTPAKAELFVRDLPMAARVKGRRNTGFLACNLTQIFVAREPLWIPVYETLGATRKELFAMKSHLRDYLAASCQPHPDFRNSNKIASKINRINADIERRLATAYSLSEHEATSLRLDALARKFAELATKCGIPDTSAFAAIGDRLPMTPGGGYSTKYESNLIQYAFGGCKGAPAGGSGVTLAGTEKNAMLQCMSDIVARSSSNCSNPAGDEPVGREGSASPRDPATQAERDEERRELGVAENMHKQSDTGWVMRPAAQGGGGSRTRVFGSADGASHTIYQDLTVSEEHGAVYVRADVYYDSRNELDHNELEVRSADGQLDSHQHFEQTTSAERAEDMKYLRDVSGFFFDMWKTVTALLPRDCRSFNPSSPAPLGYQSSSASPATGLLPRFLGGENLVAYCACKGGKRGQQMANMLGYGCGNSDLTRISCLADPHDGHDGIRRECIQSMLEDNWLGRVNVGAMCESVIQCPQNTTAVAGMDVREDMMRCACRASNGSLVSGRNPNNRNPGCSLVSCPTGPQAGDAGQQSSCCVSPPPGTRELAPLGALLPGIERVVTPLLTTKPELFKNLPLQRRQELLGPNTPP